MHIHTESKLKKIFLSEGQLFSVDRCYRLLMHDPTSVIYLETGEVDLFAVNYPDKFSEMQKVFLDEKAINTAPFLAEVLEGLLTYIGSWKADQMLFPFPLTEMKESRRIVIIISEPAKIYKLSFSKLEQMAQADPLIKVELGEGLKQWISQLSQTLQKRILGKSVCLLNLHEQKEFHPAEAILKKRSNSDFKNEIVWAQVKEGTLVFFSDLESKQSQITKTNPPFPLFGNISLIAVNQGSVYGLSTEEVIDMGELRRSVLYFHDIFLTTFYLYVLQKEGAELARVIAQEKLENHQIKAIYNQVQAVVAEEKEVVLTPTNNQLFDALRIIGEDIGCIFQYSPEESEQKSIASRIYNFCVFSKVNYRPIYLEGEWWLSTIGSLLCFRKDGTPIAAIRDRKENYILVDSETHNEVKIDASIAASLCPEAYIFYPNLHGKYPITFWELLQFSLRKQFRSIRSICILSFMALVLAQFAPLATYVLFDKVIPNLQQYYLFDIFIGLLMANIGITLFKFVEENTLARLITISDINGNAAVCDRLLSLPIQFFRTYQVGSLLQKVIGWTTIIRSITGQPIRVFINAVFSFLYLISMIIYSPALSLLGVCVLFACVLLSSIFLIKNNKFEYKLLEIKGLWTSKVIEIVEAISKIKTSGLEKRMFVVWEQLYIKYKLLEKKIGNNSNIFTTILGGNLNFSLFGFFFLMSYYLTDTNIAGDKQIKIAQFAAFMVAFGPFSQAVINLLTAAISLLSVKPTWDLCKVLFSEKTIYDTPKLRILTLNGSIKIEHVSFRYNEDEPLILRDINIEAKPGDLIGLVGLSGSGKSTILRLLLGLEKPETGAIFYDDKSLQELDLEDLRSHFGIVMQESTILSGTLREIIAGGRFCTQEQIARAVKMAGLEEDISALPMGLDTVVLNGGYSFSGGQRQRIIIARALIGNPRVLFLDEATSALDNKTQQAIKENIDRMDVTRIVAAHRLDTVREADCIYVLHEGRIIQKGRYEELAAEKGLFKELLEKQKI